MYSSFLEVCSEQQKIDEAKQLLLDNGYLVRGPLLVGIGVKTPSDLVRYFYDKLMYHNPDFRIGYHGERKRDLKIARNFIEARKKTGLGKDRALVECCILIDILFRYESYLGLSFKVSSMNVLGQEQFSWVTDKLVDIYNGINIDIALENEQIYFERLYFKQEEELEEDLVKQANKRLGIGDTDGK